MIVPNTQNIRWKRKCGFKFQGMYENYGKRINIFCNQAKKIP